MKSSAGLGNPAEIRDAKTGRRTSNVMSERNNITQPKRTKPEHVHYVMQISLSRFVKNWNDIWAIPA